MTDPALIKAERDQATALQAQAKAQKQEAHYAKMTAEAEKMAAQSLRKETAVKQPDDVTLL